MEDILRRNTRGKKNPKNAPDSAPVDIPRRRHASRPNFPHPMKAVIIVKKIPIGRPKPMPAAKGSRRQYPVSSESYVARGTRFFTATPPKSSTEKMEIQYRIIEPNARIAIAKSWTWFSLKMQSVIVGKIDNV